MWIRPETGRAAASATACLFAIAVLALPALGQPVALEAVEDEAGLAWLGCWELLADREDDSQGSPGERQRICVAPGDERDVRLTGTAPAEPGAADVTYMLRTPPFLHSRLLDSGDPLHLEWE